MFFVLLFKVITQKQLVTLTVLVQYGEWLNHERFCNPSGVDRIPPPVYIPTKGGVNPPEVLSLTEEEGPRL